MTLRFGLFGLTVRSRMLVGLPICSDKLENQVYTIPEVIDRDIARLKLDAMGIKIDTLTEEQQKYLTSWEEGT